MQTAEKAMMQTTWMSCKDAGLFKHWKCLTENTISKRCGFHIIMMAIMALIGCALWMGGLPCSLCLLSITATHDSPSCTSLSSCMRKRTDSNFPPSALRCPVMQPGQQFKKLHLFSFMCLRGGTFPISPSLEERGEVAHG